METSDRQRKPVRMQRSPGRMSRCAFSVLWHRWTRLLVAALPLFLSTWLFSACAPTAEENVLGYWLEQQLHTLSEPSFGPTPEPGAIRGVVRFAGAPVSGVSVLVAERTGTPHTARTDSQGGYRIEGVPPGQYVLAATGADFDEVALTTALGVPWPVTVPSGQTVVAPPLALRRHVAPPLPALDSVNLTAGMPYTATAPFPEGAAARVQPFQFERAGTLIDSLRVYQPLAAQGGEGATTELPLLFAVFPGEIEGWEPASVAFASQGFTLVAISPSDAHGVDIDAHTLDARLALALAQNGYLGLDLGGGPAVAMGGSFSSAILHRLLRDEREHFAAWVTVGGISNAFTGAADFYAGELAIPEKFSLVIPALGPANIYPLPFLRYSPVYTAAQLPPTMIVHTGADHIIPISQAYELEAALRTDQVPVEVFYYEDVSHYLQIGEDLTPTGAEMFYRILAFVRRYVGD